MAEHRHSGHAVCDIKYHLVWITKYRYKILRGEVAERARDLIRQIYYAREVVIVRGSVPPDHIHMLVAAPAHMAPSKLVQYINGRSSRRLQEEFPSLRKRYWGQHLWARWTRKRLRPISRIKSGMKTIRALRLPRRASLEPALSRESFRRLQPCRPTFSRTSTYRLQAVVVWARSV